MEVALGRTRKRLQPPPRAVLGLLTQAGLDTATPHALGARHPGRAALLHLQCGCHTALPDGQRWFCVNTKPHAEFTALADITSGTRGRRTLRAWLPLFVDYERGASIQPLFRSYLFVALDPTVDAVSRAWYSEGVRQVISSANNRPIPLPHGFVESLQARGRAGDGVIDERSNAPAFQPVCEGDGLRVLHGPFVDQVGICRMSDGERIKVLLGALEVSMPRSAVEKL